MNLNPKILKTARYSRGKSLATLSIESGIDKAMLSRIETGQTASYEHLQKISTALNYPISFFSQSISEARYSNFFYRKRATTPAKQKEQLDAQIDILRMLFDRLIDAAEIPEQRLLNISPRKGMSPEEIATMAREFYGIGKGPLLNLVNILEKAGIGILYLDTTSEKFDGVTSYSEKGFPLIVINKNKSNDRKRFTLAHELGHLIMHFPFRFEDDFYKRLENENDNIFENEADRFASEFLMPSSDILPDLFDLTYGRLGLLKQYWNVSKSSIIRKAKSLGRIDDTRYRNLQIELSRNGERKQENGSISFDEPQIFKKLIEFHISELHYTISELSENLYISEADLNKLKTLHGDVKLRIAV